MPFVRLLMHKIMAIALSHEEQCGLAVLVHRNFSAPASTRRDFFA